MNADATNTQANLRVLTNGPAAAAILAAGLGCFSLSLLAVAADQLPAMKIVLNVYNPTGALSGVSTGGIGIWLAAWAILHFKWRFKTLPSARVSAIALIFLCLSLALTFPPIADLF